MKGICDWKDCSSRADYGYSSVMGGPRREVCHKHFCTITHAKKGSQRSWCFEKLSYTDSDYKLLIDVCKVHSTQASTKKERFTKMARTKAAKKFVKKTEKKVPKKSTEKKVLKKSTEKKGSATKGATLGLGICATWSCVFSKNEKATRAKKLTDEQIGKFMVSEFPDRGSSNLTKVQSNRNCYNKGVFDKGVKPPVPSSRYDEEGKTLTISRGRGSSGTGTASTQLQKTSKKVKASAKTGKKVRRRVRAS